MKNKKIYIIIGVLAIIILLLILLPFFINKFDKRRQWSIENQTTITKRAVQEYVKQDSRESTEERNNRLKKYFASDSPVFEYGTPEIKSQDAERSSGKVVKILECEEQEGGDLCLIAVTDVFFYNNKERENKKINFWLTIKKIDNYFRVYDIGVWDIELPE